MDEVIRRLMFKPYRSISKSRSQLQKKQPGSISAKRLYILHEGSSATIAYFSISFCMRYPECAVHYQDITQPPAPIIAGDVVIIVRHLPFDWQHRLTSQLKDVHLVVYFMDDDLLDPLAFQGLPKRYHKKLLQRGSAQRNWITAYCDEIWVSTPYLVKKYQHLDASLIEPIPSVSLLQRQSPVRLAYHGSSSHQHEKRWLHEVIEGVLQSRNNVTFELFGEHEVYKQYRDLPRVKVLHPMSWQNYLSYTMSHDIDIGLAPLLPSGFNSARGAIKFFDFARMGAFGVYSNVVPYAGFIHSNQDGILLRNHVDIWVSSLLVLIDNPEKRATLANQAKLRARKLSAI